MTASRTRICARGEIAPGDCRAFDCNGHMLAAFNVGGRIFVTSNLCTHAEAILSEGFFEGETIECPLHGGAFNVTTGKAVQFPCEAPIATYPVTETEEGVFVDVPTA